MVGTCSLGVAYETSVHTGKIASAGIVATSGVAFTCGGHSWPGPGPGLAPTMPPDLVRGASQSPNSSPSTLSSSLMYVVLERWQQRLALLPAKRPPFRRPRCRNRYRSRHLAARRARGGPHPSIGVKEGRKYDLATVLVTQQPGGVSGPRVAPPMQEPRTVRRGNSYGRALTGEASAVLIPLTLWLPLLL